MNLPMQTQIIDRSLILRLTVAVILLMHSIPGMFNGGIDDFGKLYLDQAGFAPFGLALAWASSFRMWFAPCYLLRTVL